MLDMAEVARLAEQRQARGTAQVAEEHVLIAGGAACWSGPEAWSSMACALGTEGPVGDAELDRLVAFYDDRGGTARIEVTPFDDESLLAGLAARGFRLRSFENVLARELLPGEDLRAIVPGGWPDGVELRPPRPDEFETWARMSEEGFVEPGQEVDPDDIAVGMRMLAEPGLVALFALVDGAYAGVAAVAVDGEIAGLFGTTVRPAFRRRGIQQALLAERLLAARERGARIATIDSLPGIPTERNARRLGFEGAFSKGVLVRPSRA